MLLAQFRKPRYTAGNTLAVVHRFTRIDLGNRYQRANERSVTRKTARKLKGLLGVAGVDQLPYPLMRPDDRFVRTRHIPKTYTYCAGKRPLKRRSR